MKRWVSSLATIAVVLSFCSPVFADGQVRIIQADASAKDYPGVTVINTPAAVYLRDNSAHQTLIVQKSGCKSENGLQACSSTSVIWDRYGVQSPIAVEKANLYVNTTSKPHQITDSQYTLTPNTLAVEIATKKGTTILGYGFIDTSSAAGGEY